VEKPEAKILLGKSRPIWKYYNFFKEIGKEGVGWINLAEGRDRCRAVVKLGEFLEHVAKS
jgi:hypothetical protein